MDLSIYFKLLIVLDLFAALKGWISQFLYPYTADISKG